MFQNLSLRSKLIALATPPLVVLGVIAAYGLLLSLRGAGADLESDVKTLGILALATFIITTLAGILIGQSLKNPLDQATEAARELSEKRLPLLLETLRNPGVEVPEFEPLTVSQDDEMGDLVRALNDVQESAARLATEQRDVVRAGLQDLVVNMARRNQSLLDRQIEVIDRIESAEEDPDRLEELYRMDHLATRMRRNAESLLVLAGADPARRRGGPVAIADVLRVAMSEIEDYQHISLEEIEESKIGPQGAVDLAHLVSELLENATQFSPPDSPVKVAGSVHPDGSYLISVTDSGIGMDEAQLLAANSTLVRPPELGLGLTRSLGFIVVGRLAKRLNVAVELVAAPGGGTTAIVEVPAAALYGYSGATPTESDPTESVEGDPLQDLAANPSETGVADNEPASPNPGGSEIPGATVQTSPQIQPAASSTLATEAFPPVGDSWAPPTIPERGANPLGAPADSGVIPQSTSEAAPEPAISASPTEPAAASLQPQMPQTDESGAQGPATSAALAKLLGLDPTAATAAPADPGASGLSTPSEGLPTRETVAGGGPAEVPGAGSSIFAREETTEAPPVDNAPWSEPIFDPSLLEISYDDPAGTPSNSPGGVPAVETAPFSAVEPTAHLEEAIPSGQEFDQGMASLLAPEPEKTSTGLVKRNRSESHAPVSEGRPVAASVRSPEEIRSMLARYRDGLHGRPTTPPPGAPSEASSSDNPLNNNPFGDQS